MERYTWIELADLHLAYGATFTNGRAAHWLYQDRYPNCRIPHHTTFPSIHRRLCQSGTVHRRVDGQGRGRMSTRDIAWHFHICHVTVWKILQEMLLRPYRIGKGMTKYGTSMHCLLDVSGHVFKHLL